MQDRKYLREIDGKHEKKGQQLITQLTWSIKLKTLFHVSFNLIQFIVPWKID